MRTALSNIRSDAFWLAAALLLVSSGSVAQQVSAPIVRAAQPAKTSTTENTELLMAAAPMRIWREGDPIRVKGDLVTKQMAGLQPNSSAKSQDSLLLRSQSHRRLAAGTIALGSPELGANFNGIPATGFLPPDTIGAVGRNHYIQMVNSAFAIYDKGGHLLAGPSQINSLWKGFGGPCQKDNDGDPVVRYDHLSDRWLVSQFAINKNMQCIAISRTPDPVNGGWFLYAFPTLDENGNPVVPDYPKIGIWPDGYYMSTQRGFPNEGLDVWVFERSQMLLGKPARQIQFGVGAPSIVLQPGDLTGPAPPAGSPNFFVRQIDGERFSGQDRIEIFALSVDWAQPSSSTFSQLVDLPTEPFDSVICNASLGGACVPQPGTTIRLDTLSVWPMFRVQYRNFGAHETLVLNHTVDATGQNLAGVRWYELRRTQGNAWSIFQQGTHSPDGVHRWMGSVAMDAAGNIAVAYSVANAQTSPGVRAAARRPTFPSGTFGAEAIIVSGSGSQTGATRWGDYASMDLDPDRPCSFWFTTLYYEDSSQAGWSTRIAEVTAPDRTANCEVKVPNLEGMPSAAAENRLREAGLAPGSVQSIGAAPGSGTLSTPVVVSQKPAFGSNVPEGSVVELVLQQIPQSPL